ncbi:MAG TPA: hypothetical protein VHQ01_12395, partial [Pyrinomonadaceae bacterium]|nr:hypothetical protein [Pyrinomonadaceae bacterium]
MKNIDVKKAILNSIIGVAVLVGTALFTNAQDNSRQYRDWQTAQQQAQQRHDAYLRSNNRRDYDQWQRAEQLARQRQTAYQQYVSRYGNRYNNSSYNNNHRGMYRVNRNGSDYWVDSRGAELLKQAVNRGYQQGYQQGAMAKRRGYGYDYNRETIYRNGTYGYQSFVTRDQYQYYFQQGFQRGYEDGYY